MNKYALRFLFIPIEGRWSVLDAIQEQARAGTKGIGGRESKV